MNLFRFFQKLNLNNKTDHFWVPIIISFHGLNITLKIMPFIITLVAYFKITLDTLNKKHLLVLDLIIKKKKQFFLLTNGTYLFFSGQFEFFFLFSYLCLMIYNLTKLKKFESTYHFYLLNTRMWNRLII